MLSLSVMKCTHGLTEIIRIDSSENTSEKEKHAKEANQNPEELKIISRNNTKKQILITFTWKKISGM